MIDLGCGNGQKKDSKIDLFNKAIIKFRGILPNFSDRKDIRDESCSPLEIAERIKGLIQGKVVCDLGCRNGHFMQDLQRYAKEVIGIEKRKCFCKIARKKGFKVIHKNYLKTDLPSADVYYIWSVEEKMDKVLARLWAQNKKGKYIKGSKTGERWEIEVVDI